MDLDRALARSTSAITSAIRVPTAAPRVILTAMGYEAVRPHSRRGRIGGSYVRGSVRFTDRRAPRRGGGSPYVHGYRSASPMPILWALGALAGGVVLLLVVLTLTHMGSADQSAATDVVPSTVAPAQPIVPPQPCFPFEASC